MSEKYFKTIKYYLISIVVLFEVGHLLWEHLNGGVLSHRLLHSSDYPAMSNWWGIIILPFLAWFSTVRIKKRIRFQSDDASVPGKIPSAILIGFFGMLIVSILQSIAFNFGYENITMYMALGVLLIGLFLPIYQTEYILGHVLGAAFTFGPIIPVIGIMVMASVSAFSNLVIKPLILRILGRKTSAT
ncbi:MAG: hypothetical protein DWQ05_16410 [Calditrichaeota bacterium]|nr:MAG: hypothetical protein DWQ05_16410 [Calditrichota bacterium]